MRTQEHVGFRKGRRCSDLLDPLEDLKAVQQSRIGQRMNRCRLTAAHPSVEVPTTASRGSPSECTIETLG
jgi:hypothetical protein